MKTYAQQVLETLQKIYKENPTLRIAQILMNVEAMTNVPLYYLDDKELLNLLKETYLVKEGKH